jgi:hypothetical protein
LGYLRDPAEIAAEKAADAPVTRPGIAKVPAERGAPETQVAPSKRGRRASG